MENPTGLTPISELRAAVKARFPGNLQVEALQPGGTLAQTWQAYALVLSISQAELARRIAPWYGVEAVKSLAEAEPVALGMVPFSFCQSHLVLPLHLSGGRLVVATANPHDTATTELLTFLVDRPVTWVLAAPQDLDEALVVAYAQEAKREAQAMDAKSGQAEIDDHAIARLGKGLMSDAVAQRASDLHIQPFLGAAVVRIRVDGSLRRLTMLPDAVAMSLMRHLKAQAGMDPTNTMVPQDGRVSTVLHGREFDLRVSSLPSVRGDRLVIRFLDQTRVSRLSGTGFSLAALQTLRRVISRPSGMVIMTGPTGSGKTSTLYAMLAELNHSGVNIITVENPVEYRIAGISQVDVNDKAGRTFAAALRSILRQDPDIVLIGEIRDAETAEIATQAALTGHLVLSTLHTNDAITAIPRLLNLGVAPNVLADSLVAVASQRLCRKLCEKCKLPVEDPLTPEEKAFAAVTHNRPAFRRGGCSHCDFTGYRGRMPIVDIVEMTPKMRDAIATGESRLTALDAMREGGLKSLAVSGSLRVISGDTTVAEVIDNVGPVFWTELSTHYGTYYAAEELDSIPVKAAEGQGILLLSTDDALAETLRHAFDASELRVVVAKDFAAAKECLQRDEQISFIIGDAPEDATAETLNQMLQEGRRYVTWARLPSAVLIPERLKGEIESFKAGGTMAAFVTKPVDTEDLLRRIRRAQAR
jgi:type IV pilus assembly protein PilB